MTTCTCVLYQRGISFGGKSAAAAGDSRSSQLRTARKRMTIKSSFSSPVDIAFILVASVFFVSFLCVYVASVTYDLVIMMGVAVCVCLGRRVFSQRRMLLHWWFAGSGASYFPACSASALSSPSFTTEMMTPYAFFQAVTAVSFMTSDPSFCFMDPTRDPPKFSNMGYVMRWRK